ncbi:hypothetical protein BAE36_22590 [Rhizobium leguminosarum bv. trifolii]|nr:hypothetical protein BAE36_22590 [Rhizobium leguminosarum bv. trifolii]
MLAELSFKASLEFGMSRVISNLMATNTAPKSKRLPTRRQAMPMIQRSPKMGDPPMKVIAPVGTLLFSVSLAACGVAFGSPILDLTTFS